MGSEMNQHESPDSPMVLLRRLHCWRMAFFGLVILLAGMLSGAAVALLTVGHIGREGMLPPERVVIDILGSLGPRLHLSAEQVQQVHPILQKHVTRLEEIRSDGRTQILAELKAMNEEIMPVLDENQQRLWQQYMQGLPGPFRHGYGPPHIGVGPGPGPGRGGRFGFRRGAPGGPDQPPVEPTVPHEGPGPMHSN
jgi:hypothetical protein